MGAGFAAPLVVTADAFRFIVTEQAAAAGVPPAAIVIEPQPRNTGPAILAAALSLHRQDPGAVLLVLPSDHVLPDAAGFRAAVAAALPRALAGDLVTFGILPSRPETGYGYLELAPSADATAATPQPVARFVEKPDAARALAMLADGGFLWNAGIFLATAKALIQAFHRHQPGMESLVVRSLDAARTDLGFCRLGADGWDDLPAVSVDYAIMEKAGNVAVMPWRGVWSDLGSWPSVAQQQTPDPAGNVTQGAVTAIDCRGSLLRSDAEGLALVGIGLDEMIVVATPDAVLVARKDDSQRVGDAVAELVRCQQRQATEFPHEHRPWGWFESLAAGDRFRVKRIVVLPGAALSLQSHRHRAEHWVVVQGTARVTLDAQISMLAENQSLYIPPGARHRLENPGPAPMVLIEVQTGSYLGEDDIIRYDDIYART